MFSNVKVPESTGPLQAHLLRYLIFSSGLMFKICIIKFFFKMHYIRQNWLYICKTKTDDENIPLNYCPSLFPKSPLV